MTNPKEALEWYERKQVEARAMADRDCNNCKHNKADGCSRWECEYEPVKSDLISRADAIEAIASRDETDGTVKVFTGREVNEIISALPSAVDVVRCKDCKWYLQKQKNLPYNVTKRYCNRMCTLATEEDDYCSYGERREP